MTTHDETQTPSLSCAPGKGLSASALASTLSAALAICLLAATAWWLVQTGRIVWLGREEADPGQCLVMADDITVCEKKHAQSGQ